MNTETKKVAKKENPLINMLLNVVLPVVILIKFSGEEYLGVVWGLIVALAFPIGYGIYDFIKTKKVNFISVLGFVSVFLTGVLGLLKLPAEWIAVKEAGVPLIIAFAIIISTKTPFPLVKKLLYTDLLFDTKKINNILTEKNKLIDFDKLMVRSAYLLSTSFFLSAILNYVFAKIILVSEPGTTAFNEELGKMQGWSFVVIALPSMAVMMLVLWYLLKQIQKLTGLELEGLFQEQLLQKEEK